MTEARTGIKMEFERIDDLIVVGRYLSSISVTEEIAKEMVRQRKEFTNGNDCKLVIVFPKLSNMDKSGRDYMASDDAKEGVLVSAMVTNSILGRAIINFFLKLNNNCEKIPTKVFNSEKEAIDWIRESNVF